MLRRLSTIIEDIGKDDEVKVVITTGNDRAFSPGIRMSQRREREASSARNSYACLNEQC
jgi:enoyl-CoA hydratase/carnithine racemase